MKGGSRGGPTRKAPGLAGGSEPSRPNTATVVTWLAGKGGAKIAGLQDPVYRARRTLKSPPQPRQLLRGPHFSANHPPPGFQRKREPTVGRPNGSRQIAAALKVGAGSKKDRRPPHQQYKLPPGCSVCFPSRPLCSAGSPPRRKQLPPPAFARVMDLSKRKPPRHRSPICQRRQGLAANGFTLLCCPGGSGRPNGCRCGLERRRGSPFTGCQSSEGVKSVGEMGQEARSRVVCKQVPRRRDRATIG